MMEDDSTMSFNERGGESVLVNGGDLVTRSPASIDTSNSTLSSEKKKSFAKPAEEEKDMPEVKIVATALPILIGFL